MIFVMGGQCLCQKLVKIIKSPYIHRMNNDALPRGLSFLAGAAAGLVLGYYLHSEKGSALRQKITENWGDVLDDLGGRTQEHLDDLITLLSDALDKGLSFADLAGNQLQENVEQVGDDADDARDDAETSFENGMDRARERLQQKFKEAGV